MDIVTESLIAAMLLSWSFYVEDHCPTLKPNEQFYKQSKMLDRNPDLSNRYSIMLAGAMSARGKIDDLKSMRIHPCSYVKNNMHKWFRVRGAHFLGKQ